VTKRCPNCRLEKAVDAFGLRKRSPSGRKSWCRACEAVGQRHRYRSRLTVAVCIQCGRQAAVAGTVLCGACTARRAQQRLNRKAAGVCDCGAPVLPGLASCARCLEVRRVRELAQNGLSTEDYQKLLTRQDGRCAICRRRCGRGRRLAVDHDHATGRVRGLLCFRCNTSLARYEEYSEEFARYLTRSNMPAFYVVRSASTSMQIPAAPTR
jgi:hypothetical protein